MTDGIKITSATIVRFTYMVLILHSVGVIISIFYWRSFHFLTTKKKSNNTSIHRYAEEWPYNASNNPNTASIFAQFREPGCTQPNQGSTKLLAWWQVAADPFPKWRRFYQSAAGCLIVFSFVAGSEEHQKPNQGQQIDTRNSELLLRRLE